MRLFGLTSKCAVPQFFSHPFAYKFPYNITSRQFTGAVDILAKTTQAEIHARPEIFAARELPLQELDFDSRLAEGTILLRAWFEKREVYRLIEEYGAGCYSETGRKLLFEQSFASYQNMRQWVLSFGNSVEVNHS